MLPWSLASVAMVTVNGTPAVGRVPSPMSTLQVPHLAPRLGELTCPVLGWWGIDDQFCPPSGATTLARECKDARVVTLSRCGHWVMVEHTDLFNRWTLEFLAES